MITVSLQEIQHAGMQLDTDVRNLVLRYVDPETGKCDFPDQDMFMSNYNHGKLCESAMKRLSNDEAGALAILGNYNRYAQLGHNREDTIQFPTRLLVKEEFRYAAGELGEQAKWSDYKTVDLWNSENRIIMSVPGNHESSDESRRARQDYIFARLCWDAPDKFNTILTEQELGALALLINEERYSVLEVRDGEVWVKDTDDPYIIDKAAFRCWNNYQETYHTKVHWDEAPWEYEEES